MHNPTYAALDQNFSQLRRAINEKNYEELDAFLAEQRNLAATLPFSDPEARAYLTQAQDLTAWSLNMVKLQRSALANAISEVSRKKLLQDTYVDSSESAVADFYL